MEPVKLTVPLKQQSRQVAHYLKSDTVSGNDRLTNDFFLISLHSNDNNLLKGKMLIALHPSPHLSAARWVNRPWDQCCSAGNMSWSPPEFKYWSTNQWFTLDVNTPPTSCGRKKKTIQQRINHAAFEEETRANAKNFEGKMCGRQKERETRGQWHSQFNGFVPHDDIAWEHKGLHVDDVDVPPFCADVQPLTLEGQVAESYSVERERNKKTGVSWVGERE